MNLLFVCHDLSNNALGRVWSLSLLADELGWSWQVIGRAEGPIWGPLRDDRRFSARCLSFPRRGYLDAVRAAAREVDVVVAAKAFPASLGACLGAGVDGKLILDVDDDDLGAWLRAQSPRQRIGIVHPSHYLEGTTPRALERLQGKIPTIPRTVSNPVLQELYGGAVVPHVRQPRSRVPLPEPSDVLRVGFVGTPRPHKGLEVLREGVAALGGRAVLTVTADSPPDAKAWERWLGQTALTALPDVVRDLDVLSVPTRRTWFGRHQLPVKAIDAMMLGRPLLITDLRVLRWATDGAAVHVAPDDAAALARGLRELFDPDLRVDLAERGHETAMSRYVPSAVADRFATTVLEARR